MVKILFPKSVLLNMEEQLEQVQGPQRSQKTERGPVNSKIVSVQKSISVFERWYFGVFRHCKKPLQPI